MKKRGESIRSFYLPCIPGVEVIFGQGIANTFRRHIHHTFIIGLVTEGRRLITDDRGSVSVSENEVFIIPPGHVHACRSDEGPGHSYRILSIAPRTMQDIARQVSGEHETLPCFMTIHFRDQGVCGRLKDLFTAMENPDSEIHVEAEFHGFLADLIIGHSKHPPALHSTPEHNDSVIKACEYIRSHFAEKLSLKTLARVACLSPFHFQREFKKTLGITPHEYLNDFRIGRAKRMLKESKNLSDIAVQLGFYDQGHFSRVFRGLVGVSPGKYMKTNKHKDDGKIP